MHKNWLSDLFVSPTNTQLEIRVCFVEIQQWRSVNVEIGLLRLLWLRLLTSYFASGQISRFGE